jgi:ribosomal protein L16 Arg81 hydroxylase
LNRNSNNFSVEVPAGKIYDRDSEAADPLTPTPEIENIKKKEIQNNISIRNDEEQLLNPGIECQTDFDNGLKLKLRQSKKSF